MLHRVCFITFVSAMLVLTGCVKPPPPPTLVIHYRDDVYDLIDHDGKVIRTAHSLDEIKSMSRIPKIRQLIRDGTVIARFEEIETPDGLDVPDEVIVLLAPLVGAGVDRLKFECTNKPGGRDLPE